MTLSDCETIATAWERSLPFRYWVDASLIAFNTIESGLVIEGASFVDTDEFVVVKRSTARPDLAVLSSLVAKDGRLLRRTRDVLRLAGYTRWQFGGDQRHFFPGVPSDLPELAHWLEDGGLSATGVAVYDVERDLAEYSSPCVPSPDARPCTQADRNELEGLLEREFSTRWLTDTLEKFDEDPSRIMGLFLDGRCVGFAMTQLEGDRHRRAGAVWSKSHGPHWAALGPIGIAQSLRGLGHGDALLAASLIHLKGLGARRTSIDWTTLTGFYGRHGFEVSREYRTYAGSIDQ